MKEVHLRIRYIWHGAGSMKGIIIVTYSAMECGRRRHNFNQGDEGKPQWKVLFEKGVSRWRRKGELFWAES